MAGAKDEILRARVDSQTASDARAMAQREGVKVSEFVRQAVATAISAENAKRELGRIARRSRSATIPAFETMEGPARAYAAGGAWAGRETLAAVLMGLASLVRKDDPARGASLYGEAASILAGCVTDAPNEEDRLLTGQWADLARMQSEAARSGRGMLYRPKLAGSAVEKAAG